MAMTRAMSWRLALGLIAAEAVTTAVLLLAAPAPAGAQFDDRFPFQNRRQPQPQQPRGMFDWFTPQPQYQQPSEDQQRREREREREPAPVDYSKAPAPKKSDAKTEAAITTPIMVLGDSMADWLAYGLELAYADSPEIGILRRHRTNSGLIRNEARNDPRGEYPDWPQAARDLIAAQKPKYVLMMIGINDRRSLRETASAAPAPAGRNGKTQPRAEGPAALELDKAAPEGPEKPADKPAEAAAGAAPDTPSSGGNRTLEFRTDAWSEAYIRRIDDTVAALKTSNVPVFWVGLPPLRGQKSAADISFLNDLYRSRADKAGIIYIDVWDGFVDEDGRYAQSGPDLEGQTRRLRTGDGVHFTQAGARKLAHYVEREIQRWMTAQATPAALPEPEQPNATAATVGPATAHPAAPATAVTPDGARARPLAGPTVPLIADRSGEADNLLGGNARGPGPDPMVNKVLSKGEAVRAPAGRADDFAWPRRAIAPVGSDPVVTTTDLPMTPMLAEKPASGAAAAPATAAATGAGKEVASAAPARPRRATPRPSYADAQQSVYRPDYRRQQQPTQQPSFFGFPLFGGGRW
jgi:uncharacterized protein